MNKSSILELDIDEVHAINTDAAEVLHAAQTTLRKIFKTRHKLDKADNAHEPLFILAGEYHTNVLSPIFHMLVLKGLSEANKTVLPFTERAHDYAHGYKTLGAIYNRLLKEENNLQEIQVMYEVIRNKVLSKLDIDYCAPYTNKMFFNFCEHEVNKESGFLPMVFNDVSKAASFSFDPKNPYIKTTIDILKFNGHINHNDIQLNNTGLVNTCSDTGMLLRNYFMASKLLSRTSGYNFPFIYQICGANHLRNLNIETNNPEKADGYGIATILERAQKNVLAFSLTQKASVIPWRDDYFDLPLRHSYYTQNQYTDNPYGLKHIDFQSRKAEKEYTDQVFSSMGLLESFMVPQNR